MIDPGALTRQPQVSTRPSRFQLHDLTGGESRRRSPLRVVATQLARHVHHFADKVEPGNTRGFHCL